MSRITKSIAHDIAVSLGKKKKKDWQDLFKKFQTELTIIYRCRIPQEVMSFNEQYGDFVRGTKYVRLQGNGFVGHNSHDLTEILPKNSDTAYIVLTSTEGKLLFDLEQKVKMAEEQYRKLVDEIEIAILNLKTYKNVEKEFPEAVQFLPKTSVNTSLIVNIVSIREKLNS